MEILGYNFTAGSDPEVFIRNKKTGFFICPHKLIPGTKLQPAELDSSGNTIQLDGFAAEIGVPPCSTRKEFVDQHLIALKSLKKLIGPRYEVVVQPTAHFSKKEIDNAPEHCKELGCDPDYNAYISVKGEDGKPIKPAMPEVNPRPTAENLLFRTGGGHVHVGWNDDKDNADSPDHIEACRLLTVSMDHFLGAPSTLADKDKERRSLYGKAGAFRPKFYGMEYRSMSNWWLKDAESIGWVYDRTMQAINALWDQGTHTVKAKAKKSREAINSDMSPVQTIELFKEEKNLEELIGVGDV